MSEKTLVLIKPDAVKKNVIGQIINEYERNGLVVSEMKMMTASEETAKTHYAEHEEKPFFGELVDFITSSPLVALIIEGENAIARVRAINGATNPAEAADNTIRALYATDISENAVHASDSVESAEKEIQTWFG